MGIVEPFTEQSIDWSLDQLYQHGVRSFAIQVSPGAQPTTLGAWLATRQLTFRDN